MKMLLLILLTTIVINAQIINDEFLYDNIRTDKINHIEFAQNPVSKVNSIMIHSYDTIFIHMFNSDFSDIIRTVIISSPENYQYRDVYFSYANESFYVAAFGDDAQGAPKGEEMFLYKINENGDYEELNSDNRVYINSIQFESLINENGIFVISDILNFSDVDMYNIGYKIDFNGQLVKSDTINKGRVSEGFYMNTGNLSYNEVEKEIYHTGLYRTMQSTDSICINILDYDLNKINKKLVLRDTLLSVFGEIISNDELLVLLGTRDIDELGIKGRETKIIRAYFADVQNEINTTKEFRNDTINEAGGMLQISDEEVFLYGTTGGYYEEFNLPFKRGFDNYLIKYNFKNDEIDYEFVFGEEDFYDKILKMVKSEEYYLIITNHNNRLKVYKFLDIPTSIAKDAIFSPAFLISPNPASDYIEISFSNKGLQPFANSGEFVIYDVLGERVYSTEGTERSRSAEVGNGGSFSGYFDYAQQPIRIDISHLPRGVYFVRIGGNIEKFVK